MRDRKQTKDVKGARDQQIRDQDAARAQHLVDEAGEASKHEEAKAMERRLQAMMLAEDQIHQAASKRQARLGHLRAKEDEARAVLQDVDKCVAAA